MRPRWTAFALAALLPLATSSLARAQEAGQDEVTLKNGGVIRGTVVSSEPGTSVKIIEMGQKEVRVIPWAQVSDVERGKYAPKSTAQPGPAGPGYGAAPPPQDVPAPEPKLGAPGVVRLHIDSPRTVEMIEQRTAAMGSYGGYGFVLQQFRPVCTSPCDKVIDGSQGQAFTLGAEGMTPTKPFNLTGMTGDVTLHVEPGPRGRWMAGLWLTIIGGSSLLVGAIGLPISFVGSETVGGTRTTSSFTYASIGMLAGGAVLLGTGIALFATSTTKIKLDQGAAPGKAAKVQPRYWLGEF